MIKIKNFIENFKKGFSEEYLEEVFTQGNCFHFALMLKAVYEEGIIYYAQHEQHFVFEYLGEFYDITGEIEEPMDAVSLEELKENDEYEYLELVENCLYKLS